MKKLIFGFLLALFLTDVQAKNNISGLVPVTAADWNTLSVNEKQNGVPSKLVYRIVRKNISGLKNERPYVLPDCISKYVEQHGDISVQEVLALLNSDEIFVLHKYVPMGIEKKSYGKINRGTQTVGEFSFGSGNDGLLVSGSFVYRMCFVDGTDIYEFWINFSLSGSGMDLLNSLPDIWYKKDGRWYWQCADSRYALYTLLQKHDTRLQGLFPDLQAAWERIRDNLEIDGVKITVQK
jgi:hypothetical protein